MAYSIKFKKTTPLIPKGNFIEWSFDKAAPSGDYFFDLYRSGSIKGPWEIVVLNLKNKYNYFDTFTQPLNTNPDILLRPNFLSVVRNFFYKLISHCPDNTIKEDVIEEGPNLHPKQRQLFRKMLRDEYIQLHKFNGVPTAVLKRKNWGERCTKCFDTITKETIKAHCTICWGTGFTGGYWEPVLTYTRRHPLQTVIQIAPENKIDSTTAKFMLLNIPRVERDDIIVFLPDNRRFVIDQQTETSLKTVTVHQTVFGLELPRSHILYNIKVDMIANPPLM